MECSAEQTIPGRVLVCEYFMLARGNAQLADLHEHAVLAGRAGGAELKRWVSARDACQDVACLDRLFEAGIREARLALAEADDSQAAPILVNARGVPLRIAQAPSTTPPAQPDVVQEIVARERSALDTAASLVMVFFLAVALAYAFVVRRLVA